MVRYRFRKDHPCAVSVHRTDRFCNFLRWRVQRGLCHASLQNDFPFPYKITIEVSSADQSSIDAIRRVGGTVRVVYRHPLNLRAHVKPYKFEVLPKTVSRRRPLRCCSQCVIALRL